MVLRPDRWGKQGWLQLQDRQLRLAWVGGGAGKVRTNAPLALEASVSPTACHTSPTNLPPPHPPTYPLQAAMMCKLVYEGDMPQLRLLLRAGASPNVQDYDQQTPLHIAAADANLPAVSCSRMQQEQTVAKDCIVCSG